jgi:hypothetical protein
MKRRSSADCAWRFPVTDTETLVGLLARADQLRVYRTSQRINRLQAHNLVVDGGLTQI